MKAVTRWLMAGLALSGWVAGPAAAQTPSGARLFDSDEILQFRLVADLKSLMEDRDSLKAQYHPGTLSYLDASGHPVSMEVQLRTRGHWRRQKKNCDFAPIKVDLPRSKAQPEGSIFAHEGDLKLITHCRSKDAVFE